MENNQPFLKSSIEKYNFVLFFNESEDFNKKIARITKGSLYNQTQSC